MVKKIEKRPKKEKSIVDRFTVLKKIQILVFVAPVVLAIFCYFLLPSNSDIPTIGLGNSLTFKDIFASGNPTLIQCVNSTIPVLPYTHSLQKSLKSLPSGSSVSIYGFNCHEEMANKKNFFDLFRIPSVPLHESFPYLFLLANTLQPKAITIQKSSTPQFLAEFIIKKSKPKFHSIINNENLNSTCFKLGGCALIFSRSGKSISEKTHPWIQSVMEKYRSIRFSTFGGNYKMLSFHSEIETSKSDPEIVMIRKKENEFFISSRNCDEFTEKSVIEFLSSLTDSNNFDDKFKLLSETPKLRGKKPSKTEKIEQNDAENELFSENNKKTENKIKQNNK
eukprot:c7910_g1_i1.p1 GENE.c7910_g1_i1~~c7910_g1_i1.p1  ORF type:complete len:336 (-),score=112.02 c7910_g1_i1:15-1022(-)